MRFVVQRVCEARVSVEDQVIGQIGHGLLVLVGVADSDDKQIADKMIDKLTKLRIFDDADGKTNLSAADVGDHFTVYLVCGLPKGKQTLVYFGGKTGQGKRAV